MGVVFNLERAMLLVPDTIICSCVHRTPSPDDVDENITMQTLARVAEREQCREAVFPTAYCKATELGYFLDSPTPFPTPKF